MRGRTIALAVLTLLAGCEFGSQPAGFSLVAVGSDVYRLDVNTGQVSRVTPEGVKAIPDIATPLVVGQIYTFEDGKRMKYSGGGKFESAVTVKNWN